MLFPPRIIYVASRKFESIYVQGFVPWTFLFFPPAFLCQKPEQLFSCQIENRPITAMEALFSSLLTIMVVVFCVKTLSLS
jgi:hypothetical protein